MRLRFWAILLCVISTSAFSWNSLGHKLIAQIAYDQLSYAQKRILNHYNRALDSSFAARSLVSASIWLDTLYQQKEYAYLKPYHYVDLPYAFQISMPLPEVPTENAIRAIQTALQHFNNPNATAKERGLALRILLHVVGDLHQPLHTITWVDPAYPHGDRGGNLFLLGKNSVANNLHAYWDRGGGALKNTRVSYKSLKHRAKRLEKQWPCDKNNQVLNPQKWAWESHQIAIKYAYTLKPYQKPNKIYKQQVKKVSEQRIALAGCRLGVILSSLVSVPLR